MNLRVIDVSSWQGKIDWDQLSRDIDGAIIRCGYGSDIASQDDNEFKRNADECTRLGVPFGVYLYSYADCESKAKSEAQHILRLIKPYKLSYPVYLDCEENKPDIIAYSKTACRIVGNIIEKEGYIFGVYANLSWWNNYLVGLDEYSKWVAQYNSVCQYSKPFDMWQYTSSGSVSGVGGRVDMNECYVDFPKLVSGNANTPTEEPTNNKTINEQRIKDYTTHFTSSEFSCKCGGKYCDGHPDTINIELLKYLEQIRSYFGSEPVYITSALRCSQHNKNEGGVSNSKHLYGLAVDFYIKNITADRIIAYVKTLPNYRYAYKIVGDVVHLDVIYKPVSDDKIKVTGKLDEATIKALQKFLKVSEDGIIGKQTATALQEWLNK